MVHFHHPDDPERAEAELSDVLSTPGRRSDDLEETSFSLRFLTGCLRPERLVGKTVTLQESLNELENLQQFTGVGVRSVCGQGCEDVPSGRAYSGRHGRWVTLTLEKARP